MLLVRSAWDNRPSFRLIPLVNECPYVDILFDPTQGTLALVSIHSHQKTKTAPRLDANGDVMVPHKMRKSEPKTGIGYSEERLVLTLFHEYYLTDLDDIAAVVEALAVNSADFDFAELITQAAQARVEREQASQVVYAQEKSPAETPFETGDAQPQAPAQTIHGMVEDLTSTQTTAETQS